jgi:glycoprotein endo-alpha-1,2-mannosidase
MWYQLVKRRSIRFNITAAALITFLIISLGNWATAITVTVQQPAKTSKYGFSSSAELVGTFYYGWYKGRDHLYEGWDTDHHNPPSTWASNYLADIGSRPNAFDPTHNLYESQDQYILTKQLEWMKQAGMQFGISIWEGIGTASDNTFSYIINNIMPSINNPYPSFKWTIHYELEGYSDPPVENLMKDLNYIKEKYASSPYYLKIDGKPVIFVFNSVEAGSNALNDLVRWSMIRESTGFYVVMKVDPLYEGANPNSMDGWYEYNPIKRFEQQQGFSAFVSPGFWQYHQSPKLARNVTDFEIAVQKLASANVHFKLIETWNEWFEGTQVEPAIQIVHDDVHGFRPQSPSYANTYISILGKYFTHK